MCCSTFANAGKAPATPSFTNDPRPMPNDHCPLCLTIAHRLSMLMTLLEPQFAGVGRDTPQELRAHVLAAICSWWMTEAMQDPTLGPDAIVRCVANCLAHEHGVPGAERLTAVRLSRTT
jgi:hypothetical protein